MNPIREAAIAIADAEKRYPGLRMQIDVSDKYVHISANMHERQIVRSVSWTEIEMARFNVVSITVALALAAVIDDP